MMLLVVEKRIPRQRLIGWTPQSCIEIRCVQLVMVTDLQQFAGVLHFLPAVRLAGLAMCRATPSYECAIVSHVHDCVLCRSVGKSSVVRTGFIPIFGTRRQNALHIFNQTTNLRSIRWLSVRSLSSKPS